MRNYLNRNKQLPETMSIPFRTCSKEFLDALIVKNSSPETISGYGKDLSMINTFLEERFNGIVMLEDIQTEDLDDYLTMLSVEKKYKPRSVNRHINTIRSFYNHAIKKGWTLRHAAAPLEQHKVPKKERTSLDEQEYSELIHAIEHPTIKVIIQFLYFTGLRITECLTMQVEDVNLNNKTIHVKNGKGNKERMVPITDKLMPILSNYLENVRPDVSSKRFFALTKTGKVSDIYVNRVLHETTQQLGWSKVVTCHILRHSFASNLVNKNVHIAHISSLLGHADLKTTSVYVHSNPTQLAEAVSVL